ncbi:hypothetical protein TanjilG_08742 [Lupinus angustifolius]|uniref:glutathione gamma-glutamylcysteinyltransferase n=1 Tax=Lupinus angustifolius TaxID=3871 RepID=A0A4P1QQ47_LUPAN|nr:hypothetical protein TanjilG_08742 [Lupinus angustifolius]
MASPSLYRRTLPSPPAIEFSSHEGKKIFGEALSQGTMEGFFKLISYYQTQSEPAYCGLATVALVLNALSIDPGRKWKGPWRWFDDSMLDCCEPLDIIKEKGITFGKVACLAQCNGAKVGAFRSNESTIDNFRKHVISCSSSEDCHVIVSYHRGTFNQSCRHEGWSSVARFLSEDVPLLLKFEDLKDIHEVLSSVFKSPPDELRGFITWVAEVRRKEDGNLTLSEKEIGRLAIKADILEQIRKTALFRHVTRWLDSEYSCCNANANIADKDMLPELAESVCCQGADLLTGRGRLGVSAVKCCSQIEIKHLNADGKNPVSLVSGMVTHGGNSEQEVDVLVPLCRRDPSSLCHSSEGPCIGMHPSRADALTVLLLALPFHTWSGIKEEKLQVEVISLLETENLPPLLQDEHTNSFDDLDALEAAAAEEMLDWVEKWRFLECYVLGQSDFAFEELVATMSDRVDQSRLFKRVALMNRVHASGASKRAPVCLLTPSTDQSGEISTPRGLRPDPLRTREWEVQCSFE